MHLLITLNIFAIILFGSVRCDKYHPHNHNISPCMDVRKGMESTMRETNCKPRPQLVELAPIPGYELKPATVSVNKCIGACPHNTCVPTIFGNVTHVIRRMKRNDRSTAQCIVVEVEEHKKCKCMCNLSQEKCHPGQIFDKPSCSCTCKNRESEKQSCEGVMGMQWFDDFCECRCMMMSHICTSGLHWNSETCECE